MPLYPLICRFSQVVKGEHFTAQVRGDARVLIEQVDHEWVCSGVLPGGLAEVGASPGEAYAAFRQFLGQILQEHADESRTMAEFRHAAEGFLGNMNRANDERWKDAVSALRSGAITPAHGMETLPRKAAEEVEAIQVDASTVLTEIRESPALAMSPESRAA